MSRVTAAAVQVSCERVPSETPAHCDKLTGARKKGHTPIVCVKVFKDPFVMDETAVVCPQSETKQEPLSALAVVSSAWLGCYRYKKQKHALP